ncbi:restriction endonuclease subunit S [Streptomyces sp. JV185]|uniref:restriction endonuclease subunit S n=1 Tax=Streptomyces sp. JV185 TaxID=858638 RepID=UPI002E75A03C|nr:restriction endonuclease subunit S [Streptomyces sp. JV185]MEE1771398.1 restriction endonuclease subunit S [Streptomyces sp. JV185]
MTDSVTSPLGVEPPAGWELHQISDLCVKIGSGATPKGGSAVYVSNGVNFIRSQNVFDHRFSEAGMVCIDDLAARKLSGVEVEHRDVLLNITGDGDTIARCCVTPGHVLPARVNQHVMILRANDRLVPEYLQRYLSQPSMRAFMLSHNSGGSRRALTKGQVAGFQVLLPPRGAQQSVADMLGVLDDKIAVNEHIAATARSLGMAIFVQAAQGDGAVDVGVDSVAFALTRGVAPKYSDDPDELIVLNQKCIRDGRVNLAPARRTLGEKVKSPKLLHRNDVLVNSTGVGTLGRVARWTSDSEATVDSHVTIVRFDAQQVDPVCAGFAMLRAQPDIEAMGEGSTGQTELRRAQVGGLEITLPSPSRQRELRVKLDSLEDRADQALAESAALAALRDTLLPQLMSGRIRVKDAEKIVEDHV